MNTNEIAQEAAEEIYIKFLPAEYQFTRHQFEPIILSAITKAKEPLLNALRQIERMPWPNSESPYARIARDALSDSRIAVSAEQQEIGKDCKHHWRRVRPIEQEQCSICKAFRYPQCNHSQPQKERTGGKCKIHTDYDVSPSDPCPLCECPDCEPTQAPSAAERSAQQEWMIRRGEGIKRIEGIYEGTKLIQSAKPGVNLHKIADAHNTALARRHDWLGNVIQANRVQTRQLRPRAGTS